jgi:3alpha(or 20beta)-hydroxysteroid dehydrogenase
VGKLQGKVAIVTGAARGQGAVEARRLLAEGAKVVITDVLDEQGRNLAASLGGHAVYVHLDVRRESDWEDALAVAVQKFGGVDVLVNNAGLFLGGNILEQSPEEFRRVSDVNYLGPYLGMRAVIPKMLERGGGSIINISSTMGLFGLPKHAAYCGSKHGLIGLTKCAAIDLARKGIRVNVVCPGTIDTPMLNEALAKSGQSAAQSSAPFLRLIPMRRVGRSEEMAGIIAFLASDDSSYCTGGVFTVDGGMSAGNSPD